jgi:transposase
MAKKEPKRLEMTHEELEAFFDRLERDELSERDRSQIREVMTAVIWMAQKLETKELSIKRLQRLFGIKTESAKNLFGNNAGKSSTTSTNPDQGSTTQGPHNDKSPPSAGGGDRNRSDETKPAGKNGKSDYPAAECIFYRHESLKAGDACPLCGKGTLYFYGTGSVVRLTGQAPIAAAVHQPEQLRCSACQQMFTAKLPDEVGQDKADAAAKAMVCIFRYGSGIPFYRNEKLQDLFQTPLPDSTQWDMSEQLVNDVYPIYKELLYRAAQGELFHADDTGCRILNLKKDLDLQKAKRSGIFTTGILSVVDGHETALFFSGNRHAGENMQRILKLRDPDRSVPKLMCDALSRNKPKDVGCEQGSCLDHARRQFVDIIPKYADESEFFIETLKEIYRNEKMVKRLKLSAHDRLEYHRSESLPIMEGLKSWCEQVLVDKIAEPNSPLGMATKYFLNHYERLIKFATIEGMPLSNAAVERLIKTAVLHRKNSMFYKSEMGALVGDVMMSLIQTAKRAGVNVLHYLTKLQEFAADVKNDPSLWLPWNYESRLAIPQESN